LLCPPSSMLLRIVQCIFAYAVSWAGWRILRRLAVKTDLDNVPGPASRSFLTGECRLALRDLLELIDPCRKEIFRNYGTSMGGTSTRRSDRRVQCVIFIARVHECLLLFLCCLDGRVVRINAVLGVGRPRCIDYDIQLKIYFRKSSSTYPTRRLCITS
jgi:hypothetical protein